MLVRRYRDVAPVIRKDVITAYGHWIVNYQGMFLVNRYAGHFRFGGLRWWWWWCVNGHLPVCGCSGT